MWQELIFNGVFISGEEKMKKILIVCFVVFLTISVFHIDSYAGADPFLGEITLFAGNFAPRGWAFCDGQLLQVNQYSALFSILGTTYGGDGRTTFGLPDLRGRVPVHAGTGPGLSPRRLGEQGGTERHTLSVAELPSHAHVLKGTSDIADTTSPEEAMLSAKVRTKSFNGAVPAPTPDLNMHSQSIVASGGSQAHYNMQPFLGVNYIIALTGTFPSRN